VTARLALDGETARLLEAEGIEDPGDTLSDYVDPMVVLRQRMPTDAGSQSHLEPIGSHPVLVWRPCRQSTSLLLPFWLRTIRDKVIYVRVDGAVFTQLTTQGRG
jgi:hypothetical protein